MSRAARIAPGLAVAVACSVTIDERGVSNVPGEEVWQTELSLAVGQSALVDGGGLEVTLREASADYATLWIVSDESAEEHVLGLWPDGGEARVRPYRVRVIETGDAAATIEVRRRWGEWEP